MHPASTAPRPTLVGIDEGHDTALSFPTIDDVVDRLHDISTVMDAGEMPISLKHNVYEAMSRAEALLMWSEAEREHLAGLEVLLPHRLLVFWRTTRWMGEARGTLRRGEPLEYALDRDPAAFTAAVPFMHSPQRWAAGQIVDTMLRPRVLPISPHTDQQLGAEDLRRLQAAHLLVAYMLRIPAGSRKNPMYGQLGLRGMTERAPLFQRQFPTEEQLVGFERGLIDQTMRRIVGKSREIARNYLTEVNGLRNTEVESVLAMARWRAETITKSTAEEKAAVMELRLERIVVRSQKALDLKTELRAIKLLSDVQGLRDVGGRSSERELMKLLQHDRLEEGTGAGRIEVTVGTPDDGAGAETTALGGAHDDDATGGSDPLSTVPSAGRAGRRRHHRVQARPAERVRGLGPDRARDLRSGPRRSEGHGREPRWRLQPRLRHHPHRLEKENGVVMSPFLESILALVLPPLVGGAAGAAGAVAQGEPAGNTTVIGIVIGMIVAPMVLWQLRTTTRYQRQLEKQSTNRDRLLTLQAYAQRRTVKVLEKIHDRLGDQDVLRTQAIAEIHGKLKDIVCRAPHVPTSTKPPV